MGLTNEVVKLIWMAGTEYAKDNGWIYTARFMSHALNGSGTSMNYDNDSALVKTIKKSKNFNNHMKKVQDLYNSTGHGLTGNDKIIEFTVDDIPDLYYSLQHVTINTHLLNDGRIYFEFSDKYDFTQYRAGAKLIIDAAVLSGKIPEKYFTGISKGDLANDVGTYALNNGIIHSFAINCSGYYGTKNSSNASSPIEKFVSVAESQIGYHEGNNNNTKYGAWYGLNYNPWCAMFVSWCAAQAGILYSVVPRYCYCPYGVNEYQSIGRFSSRNSGYIPKRGDVIFYQEGGVSSHTGIVTGVSGNTVYTVEGNTSDMVARRTHNINDTYILGYGMCSGNGSFSSLTMLRIGSKGEAVRHLQNLLISRGYSCGSSGADGDFGQGTYNAVCAFQRDHGLDVDGIVGANTMNALIGSSGTEILRVGSKGALVKELQEKLILKGYSCGASGADGDFGQGTYNAVISFQTAAGVSADGIVGPVTWEALNGLQTNTLLRMGDSGSSVKSLQEKLIARGYSCGASGADGSFGYDTYKAVKSFQQSCALDVDGIVGPATWAALGGIDNTIMLRMGSKGDAVRRLQELLISKGYSCGASGADGDFGQGTYNAVVQLQAAYGLDQDGVVGPLTWDALNSSTFTGLLKIGSKGDAVRRLQQMLINLGYSCGASGADGDFGQGTYNAVVSFQQSRGLQVDGVVGSETWNALGGTSSYQLLRMGSKGDAVRRLQELLISKGYSCGASGADGDFGQGTYNAVCAFQEANGLDVDGVVGSQTWNALYGCGNYSVNIGGSAGVQRFLDVARSQLGYVEGYENMTKYGAWYGSNGVAWCAMFVSWCAGQAGILGSLVPRYSWCESGASWYRARGRYRTRTSGYRPLPGDIIFYSHGSDYYHTGIVEYVNGNEVHTIEGNTSDAVRRRTYDISNSNINGYGLNGGIVSDKDNVLKEAGNIGLFKGKNINFTGFSKEVPIGVVSITPLITVSAKVSYQPTIASGKVYQVGSVSPTKLSAEVMGKFGGAGIECDLREIDLEELLKNVNANFTYGDILKYSFSIKSYKAIEISIEYKMKCINEDLYQTIIIMVEKGPDGSIRLPMPVRDNGSVVIQDYTAEIVIAGILTLAVGVIAESGLLAGFGVSKVVEEIITIAKVLS